MLGSARGGIGSVRTARDADEVPSTGASSGTGTLIAQWTIGSASRRFFAVDFINGNDAFSGFSDVSMALAGTVAKKTIAGLVAIFPKIGAGRSAEIAIANGGVNTTQAYGEDLLGQLLSGCDGYAANSPIVRGTGTNVNATAVAFAGDANDCIYAGGVTSAGCNSPGYNPIGAPTNQVVQCQLAGGGAAAIPAEPAAPLMWRIRFRTDTTTVALRGVCRAVAQISTTGTANDTVTTVTTLPAVPAGTDVFVLEQAGITMTGGNLWLCGLTGVPSGNIRALQLTGLIFTSNVNVAGSGVTFAFCGINGNLVMAGQTVMATDYRFIHPLGTQTIGGGLHVTGTTTTNNGGCYSLSAFCSESSAQFQGPTLLRWNVASVFGAGFAVFGYGGNDSSSVCTIGGEQVDLTCRILGSNAVAGGGLRLDNCRALLGKIDFTNMGGRPGVNCKNSFAAQATSTALTGATGNTDFGWSFAGSTSGGYDAGGAANTLSGTAGNVRALDPTGANVVLTWAQLATTAFTDGRNRILVANGPTAFINFSGCIKTSAGAATTAFLANPGGPIAAAAAVNLTAQRYPTSLRLFTRLRVTKLTGAGVTTNNITCTLYKNNVAQTMVVTSLAADAAGTKYVDSAHPILYADGEDFDLRLDDGATDALAGTAQFSATLEYPV